MSLLLEVLHEEILTLILMFDRVEPHQLRTSRWDSLSESKTLVFPRVMIGIVAHLKCRIALGNRYLRGFSNATRFSTLIMGPK